MDKAMVGSTGTVVFDGVRISYSGNQHTEECRVRMWYQQTLFLDAVMSPRNSHIPFSIEDPKDPDQLVVDGDLTFLGSPEHSVVLLNMCYPGGSVSQFQLWPQESPTPPVPPTPPEPGDEDVSLIEDGDAEDLFPYVFLRPWPEPNPQEIEDRFLTYGGEDCSKDATKSLYCNLVRLNQQKDRKGMEAAAVAFLNGSAPYEGQVLRSLQVLPAPLNCFAVTDLQLRARPETDLKTFYSLLKANTGWTWSRVKSFITTDAFSESVTRMWQNIFALATILDYNLRLCEGIMAALALSVLVERIAAPQRSPENSEKPEMPDIPDIHTEWTCQRIHEGACATVILPPEIFPLPPAKDSTGQAAPSPPKDKVIPYAIGDLEVVRRRLVGYGMGAVSHIENVMQGQTVEVTRRNTDRSSEQLKTTEQWRQDNSLGLHSQQDELSKQTMDTLALDFQMDSQTSYGPPTEATQTGQLTVKPNKDKSPNSTSVEKAAGFARRVISLALQRLAQRVVTQREWHSEHEQELLEVHRTDGTTLTESLRGIYRWVNEIYESWVVNYGQRLVVEAIVPNPAASFIAGICTLDGISLAPPPTLAQLGVETFTDISAYDPKSKTYYARLSATLGAEQIAAPPPQTLVTSATFQATVGTISQSIAVPEGYEATQYSIAAAWSSHDNTLKVSGLVGEQPVQFVMKDEPVLPVQGNLSNETSLVPVSMTAEMPKTSARTIPPFVANVEVTSTVLERRLNEWKIQTYAALLSAQQRRWTEYRNITGAGDGTTAAKNVAGVREAIRNSLRQSISSFLLDQAARLTGEKRELLLGGAWYAQFLETALEWSEMTYSFLPALDAEPAFSSLGQRNALTNFLQAGYARAIVPVHPDFSSIFLYFLASGMIWAGRNDFTPADSSSVPLINDLKTEHPAREAPARSKSWRMSVPTAMEVLQQDGVLPVLRDAGGVRGEEGERNVSNT